MYNRIRCDQTGNEHTASPHKTQTQIEAVCLHLTCEWGKPPGKSRTKHTIQETQTKPKTRRRLWLNARSRRHSTAVSCEWRHYTAHFACCARRAPVNHRERSTWNRQRVKMIYYNCDYAIVNSKYHIFIQTSKWWINPPVNIKQQFKMLYFKHNRASCIGWW